MSSTISRTWEEAQELALREEALEVEQALLHRTFETKLTPGDGRTVDVRIIPYGERIQHDDGLGGRPKGMLYEEEWMPGVFAGQERAANRVLVNIEHEKGFAGVVGHGIALREGADGFYGSFKLHETPEGEKALMLVREGVLGTVSLEARPLKNVRSTAGVIQRVKAHLRNIALTRWAAYEGAVVLAVREEITLDESLLPIEPDPEMIERCRRLGIEIPQRYEAQPATTDTPSDEGTSDGGTRPADETSTSEEP